MQLQAQLALGRRKLTLWSSPIATLRHFFASASAACLRGALWLAQHPLTLFMGLPFVAAWLFLKQTGALHASSGRRHMKYMCITACAACWHRAQTVSCLLNCGPKHVWAVCCSHRSRDSDTVTAHAVTMMHSTTH